MRKKVALVACLLVLFLIGCTNYQVSTIEQARAVVHSLNDFEKEIQYIVLSSGETLGWPEDPRIFRSFPDLDPSNNNVLYIIIYKDAKDLIKFVMLNDDDPPEVVVNLTLN